MENTSFHTVYFEDLEANDLTCHSPSVSSASSFDFDPLDFAPQHFPPLEVARPAIPNSPDFSFDSFFLSSSRLLCMEEDDEDVDHHVSVSSFSSDDIESTLSGLRSGATSTTNNPRASKKKVISTFFKRVWQSVKHTFICSHGIRVDPLDADTLKPVPETREFASDQPKKMTSEEEEYLKMAQERPHTRLIVVKPVEEVDNERMSICTSPFSSACSDDEIFYSSQPFVDTVSTESEYSRSP